MSVFFRNILAYRLTQSVEITHEALAAKSHREPGANELSTYGFIAPCGTELCMTVQCGAIGHATIIATKKTERILPGSVVKEALTKKITEIESEQMRKVYKKERDQLKDEIVQSLLPQAFLRHKATFAAIIGDMILVDTSSPRQAEDLLSTLREAIGSLPCRPVTVKIAPSATMTDWVKAQKAPADLYVLDECELRDTHEDGGTVRCKRQDLTGEETQQHLEAGKQVTKLSLAWQDKLSFLLDDQLRITRLRFEDLLQDQAEQDGGDDAASQLQASYAIMCGTFGEFIPALLEALGGEETTTGI